MAKHDAAWTFGRKPNTSKDIVALMRAFSTPDAKLAITPEGERSWKVYVTDAKGRSTGEMQFNVDRDGNVFVYSPAAGSNQRADGGGKNFYQALFTWAHNNGYRVHGSGLSPENQFRRTVNMLSSALRFGTTDHLVPYSTQEIRGWETGKTDQNIGAMLMAMSRMAGARAPQLNALTYDPATDTVSDVTDGRKITDAELRKILGDTGLARNKGIGPATAKVLLLARAELANSARLQGPSPTPPLAQEEGGAMRSLLYARSKTANRGPGEQGAVGRPLRGESSALHGAALQTLTETELDREWAALGKAFPELVEQNDVELGNVEAALRERGYQGRIPTDVEAAIARLKGERTLIVISARAWRDRAKGAGLFTHELAHAFWDSLPAETQAALRELHRREYLDKTGPLYRDGKLQSDLAYVEDMDERGHKEWFAERTARLNESWAKGKMDSTDAGLMRRMAFRLREMLRKVWTRLARAEGIDPTGRLFTDDFRAFLASGANPTTGRQAGANFATPATPPKGNPDAETGQPGYIPTVEAMRYATAALGKERLRQLVLERHPRYAQDDPGAQINLVEPIAREAVAAAQQGQNPEQAIRGESQRIIAQARATAKRAGRLSVYDMEPEVDFATPAQDELLSRDEMEGTGDAVTYPKPAPELLQKLENTLLFPFFGNKSALVEDIAEVIRAGAKGVNRIGDMMAGAGYYGNVLAKLGYDTTPKIHNEWEGLRAATFQAIKTDVEGVIAADERWQQRFAAIEQTIARENPDLDKNERLKLKHRAIDAEARDTLERQLPADAATRQGPIPLPATPEVAGLYLALQNIVGKGKPIGLEFTPEGRLKPLITEIGPRAQYRIGEAGRELLRTYARQLASTDYPGRRLRQGRGNRRPRHPAPF